MITLADREFNLSKKNALTKIDKSHEKQWDEKIAGLCDKINKNPGFYTSSSCSGRITIVKTSSEKISDAFLFKSHDKITFDELKNVFSGLSDEIVYFRQEPCALHVACKSFEDAQDLLDKARAAGWKKSGIISSNKRFVCELFSTEMIVVPIKKGVYDDKFLKILVEEANKKLERTWRKIEKLYVIL